MESVFMSSKRKYDKEGDDRNLELPEQHTKRRHGDSEQIMWIRAIGNLSVAVTVKEITSRVGGLVRRLVGEEIHRQLSRSVTVHHVRSSPIHELRFANKVASPIYSNSNIKSVQIELVDATTGSVVTVGHLSSARIKLCVLKGEFGSQDWTADQFDANILQPREGREPLLKGETLFRLQDGVATITNLVLTDNSRWTRSRKLRLGAKVAEPSSNEENIKEGVSEPFQVKDKRGEEYKKHHPPSLSDHIWRLEKIRKNGDICKQLCSDEIKTVKDLLRLYTTNPSSLKQKFGKISNNKWETIIKHAQECDLLNEYDYSEYIYTSNQKPGQVRLLFDPIYKLVGVALYGQSYRRPDTLTVAQDKDAVERAKQHAYENLKNLIPIDEATTTSLLSQLAPHPNQSNFTPTVYQGQAEILAGSTSHPCYPMPQSSTDAGGDQCQFLSHIQFSPDTDDGNLPVLELPVIATPQDSSTTLVQHEPQHEHGIPSYTNPNFAMYMSNRGTRISMWHRILAAFKCFI